MSASSLFYLISLQKFYLSIDIKNAGFMRPVITFLNIQLSNSRAKKHIYIFIKCIAFFKKAVKIIYEIKQSVIHLSQTLYHLYLL